jgi:thiamine pyrophosphokinase
MPAEERVSHELVVVVAGGGRLAPRAADDVLAGTPVLAADDGLEQAHALGLRVTVAVGDFDSASADAVARAEAAGTRIERHPEEKDATDLELALGVAASMQPQRILVLAPMGGRLDHELAGLLLLASERYADIRIDALVGVARLHVVRGSRELEGERGELVSLIALNGPAEGVTTRGLVYPLRGETLEPGSSRGVSNVFSSGTARIELAGGVILAVRPGGTT